MTLSSIAWRQIKAAEFSVELSDLILLDSAELLCQTGALREHSVTVELRAKNKGHRYLPEGSKSLFELARVKLFVAVEVHSAEDNLKRAQADATLLLDSKLEPEVQLTDHNVLVNTVEGHRERSQNIFISAQGSQQLNLV